MIFWIVNNLTCEQFVTTAAIMTILPHFLEIVFFYGLIRGIQWFVKILTDPFTDLVDFYHHWLIHPKHWLDLRKQGNVTYKLDIYTKKIKEA